MGKLLRAGIRRYLRSPLWWVAVVASMVLGAIFGDMMYQNNTFETSFHLFPQLIFSVLISLSIGREFSDGAIRNKVISGHKKKTIFFSEMLLGMVACLILFCLFFSIFFVLSLNKLSKIHFSVGMAIFIGFLLICVSSTVMCVFISITFHRRAASAVLSLILVLALAYVASELYLDLARPEYTQKIETVYHEETGKYHSVRGEYGPNPDYIGGTQRKIYQFMIDIIPIGQAEEYSGIINDCIRGDTPHILESEQKTALVTHPFYSLGVIVVLAAGGYLIFSRRDLK